MYRTFTIARRCLVVGAAAAAAITFIHPARASAYPPAHEVSATRTSALAAPSTAELMRVLDMKLQELKPNDILFRTVLFDQIVPGTPRGGRYPFVVSLTIHDYSAGWPPNQYYGKTCLSKLQRGTFTMRLTVSNDWSVEGPVTLTAPLCQPNPSEKVSAFPLSELPGKRVGKGPAPVEVPRKRSAGVLMTGEYACVTSTGRMIANMGFRLKADRTYSDLAGARGGKYVVDAVAATIAFRGGFMDGKNGKDVETVRFAFPDAVCQRWQ